MTFKVKSDASTQVLESLASMSPVYDTLTRPVQVDVKIVKV